MKCAKVIACYLGPRREIHNTPSDIPAYIDMVMKNEVYIDNGIETDIILVNNKCPDALMNQYIVKYRGWETQNGKVICEWRENNKGSFGAYFYAFQKYMMEYDYWFFCEDDIIVFKPGYIKDFIDFLNTDHNLGFVALAPIAGGIIHSGGGCGLTSTEKFSRANPWSYIESYLSEVLPQDYGTFEGCEISFTNRYIQRNMYIANHPRYEALCSNHKGHLGQSKFASDGKEFIYKVGI